MKTTKIQAFAKQQFGIELTAAQMEIIALIAADPKEHIVGFPKRAGVTTANKVALAYLQDGLKLTDSPVPKSFSEVSQDLAIAVSAFFTGFITAVKPLIDDAKAKGLIDENGKLTPKAQKMLDNQEAKQ